MKTSKIKPSVVPMTMSKLGAATRDLNCEITVLSTDSEMKQSYIYDVESSLRLNKQAANILFAEQILHARGQAKLFGRFRTVSWENMRLLDELSKERDTKEQAFAESLIIEQIRVQEQEYFQGLVEQRQQRIEDLRKTLHDKEHNYSIIAEKLAKYEEVEDATISANHMDSELALQGRSFTKTIAKLSREKGVIKQQIAEYRRELQRIREEQAMTKQKLRGNMHYEKVMNTYRKEEDAKSEGGDAGSHSQETSAIKPYPEIPRPQSFNRLRDRRIQQLEKLLKKTKLNSQLMRLSLQESTQIGSSLHQRHRQCLKIKEGLTARLGEYETKIRQFDCILKRRMFPWSHQQQEKANSQWIPQCIDALPKSPQKNIETLLDRPPSLLIRCGSEPSFFDTTDE